MRIIFPVLFIIAAIGLFLGYTGPLYQKIKVKRADLATINEANKKAKQLREVREALTAERNKISEEDINKLKKMLPDGVENMRLIIDIQNIAANPSYNMAIRSPRINQGGTDKGAAVGPDSNRYGTLSLSFVVTTSYKDFLYFMRDLERNLRLVDVTALSFSSPDEPDGRTDFSLTIQTYWLK